MKISRVGLPFCLITHTCSQLSSSHLKYQYGYGNQEQQEDIQSIPRVRRNSIHLKKDNMLNLLHKEVFASWVFERALDLRQVYKQVRGEDSSGTQRRIPKGRDRVPNRWMQGTLGMERCKGVPYKQDDDEGVDNVALPGGHQRRQQKGRRGRRGDRP